LTVDAAQHGEAAKEWIDEAYTSLGLENLYFSDSTL
jgi:hypothetical protein